MKLQLKSGLTEVWKAIRSLRSNEAACHAVGGVVTNNRSERNFTYRIERKSHRRTETELRLFHFIDFSTQIRNVIAEAAELDLLELRHTSVGWQMNVGAFESFVFTQRQTKATRGRESDLG